MRILFILLACVAATLQPALASDRTDVIASVRQFLSGFNTGHTAAIVTACAPQAAIIDEFPPHVWQGPSACTRWMRDYASYGKREGVTDGIVKLGTPQHVDVTGDRAYVVVPASYTFKDHGRPAAESGSTLTLALQKMAARWRITAWAWTKH